MSATEAQEEFEASPPVDESSDDGMPALKPAGWRRGKQKWHEAPIFFCRQFHNRIINDNRTGDESDQ